MKKLLTLLVLVLIILPLSAFATTITQTCTQNGGTLAATGNWTAQRNNVTQSTTANTCLGSTSGDYSLDYYSNATWGNDQKSTVTVNTNTLVSSSFNSIYVIVRSSGGLGAENYYDLALRGLTSGNVSMVIYRAVNGTIDAAANRIGTSTDSTTYAAGDTFSLQVQGSTLTAYHNGVQVGNSFTDTHISTGKPGVGMFSNSTGNAIQNWTGTDVLASASGGLKQFSQF